MSRSPTTALPLAAGRRLPGVELALPAVCLGFLLITLDATIVNVALGAIVDDLGGSLGAAQWIVSAYTLAFATLLLSAGGWADRIGSRRGFLIGLATFLAGSALCAAAPSLGVLIGARALQGSGAAFLMPCSLALIAHLYPAAAARRRALAIWGGVSGIGLAGGPVIGGALVAALGWRSVFLVNLPVGALVAWGVATAVAETPRHRHPLDPLGQVLAVGAVGTLTAGFILAGEVGWTAAPTLALLGAGALAALGFLAAERRVAHPMVPPALFRRPSFPRVTAIAALFNFCLYGTLFCLALEFRVAYGLSPMGIGAALLPATALVACTAFASPRAIARLGEWWAIAVGLGAGALAALLMDLAGSAPALVLASLPLGLVSLAMPAMTALALDGVPAPRVGLVSGVQNAARQTGGAFGVAVLGSLLVGAGGSFSAAILVVAGAYLLAVALAVTSG